MVYLILKLIHVIAVIVFVGNITVSILWKLFAEKSKDPDKIIFAFKGIVKADRVFTMPSVALLLLFGIGGALHGGFSLISTGWILWSEILFIISAGAFMGKVVPIQKKIAALNSQNFNWDEYKKLSHEWTIWGIVATAAPYIAVILMVIKPNI